MISTNRIGEVEKVVRKILKSERVELLGPIKKEKVCLPKIRENKVIEIVQICSGCLGSCSYCATKLAKGNLLSFEPDKIVKEIEYAKRDGAKEFWLTGQDISCYGFDIKTSLPELLEKILEIKGKYFIRLGMLNPRYLKKIIDKLLDICEDQRIFKFFHIPVQSGSNKILKEMNRGYKVEDFLWLIKKIRDKFKEATIWTDVIVGYPSESKKDFEETLELIKKVEPDWVNVSKFYYMEKTYAIKPKEMKTSKERSRIASELIKKIAIEKNKKWNSWEGEILVDDFAMGRNFAYKAIHLNENIELGKFLKVKIKSKGLKLLGYPI
jgi:MiaB/RimO family radical SAM methylthiotransferase